VRSIVPGVSVAAGIRPREVVGENISEALLLALGYDHNEILALNVASGKRGLSFLGEPLFG
jgi:hypothetical protein